MTTRMLGIVIVVASTVIMSAVSMAIGILLGDAAPEPDSRSDADGKLSERPRYPRLNY